jgi:transcriptional regulator with XRE-family HTH domain
MFNLKEFRAAARLTQKELAELWGLRPDMISRWETGDLPAIAEYAARALKADLDSKPVEAAPQPVQVMQPAMPYTPPAKIRRRLGRPPEALVHGITNA